MDCRSTTYSLQLHLDSWPTYQSASSRCQSQLEYDWHSFVIEVLQQLLINRKMWVPQRHQKRKKNEASLFLAFAVCSRCSYGTGCRDCETINLYNDFVRFQTKWPQPLSPILNRLCLETNYEIMIWSLNYLYWKSGRLWNDLKREEEEKDERKRSILVTPSSFLHENGTKGGNSGKQPPSTQNLVKTALGQNFFLPGRVNQCARRTRNREINRCAQSRTQIKAAAWKW